MPTLIADLFLFLTYTLEAASSPTKITDNEGIIEHSSNNLRTDTFTSSFIDSDMAFPSISLYFIKYLNAVVTNLLDTLLYLYWLKQF